MREDACDVCGGCDGAHAQACANKPAGVCKADISCDEQPYPCEKCGELVCHDHAKARAGSDNGYFCSRVCADALAADERPSSKAITIPAPPPALMPDEALHNPDDDYNKTPEAWRRIAHDANNQSVARYWAQLNKLCAAVCGAYIDNEKRLEAEAALRKFIAANPAAGGKL